MMELEIPSLVCRRRPFVAMSVAVSVQTGKRLQPRAGNPSPQRATWVGGSDDYFLRETNSRPLPSLFPPIPPSPPPASKKQQCIDGGGGTVPACDFFSAVPDEVVMEIFKFLPGARDRAACASVTSRWLRLESHINRGEFRCDQRRQQRHAAGGRVERQSPWAIGDLSRCLEGKKATDTRLCAIAVGTGARGGLGKLSIRDARAGQVTDMGLSAIGTCCSALRSVSLWDCPSVQDEGLASIGRGCRLLKKLDIIKCPELGNAGLEAVARNCPLLTSLSLEDCPRIENSALKAIGKHCTALLSLNVCNCPCISDEGLSPILRTAKQLRVVKLEGLPKVTDKLLKVAGEHCACLTHFSLTTLPSVTVKGYLTFAMGCSSSSRLSHLSVGSSLCFDDEVLEAIGKYCKGLKRLSLSACKQVSDKGIASFSKVCPSIESLHLENQSLSAGGLVECVMNTQGKLKELKLSGCECAENKISQGVLEGILNLRRSLSLRSVCVSGCTCMDDKWMVSFAPLCRNVRDLDLTGSAFLTSAGLGELSRMAAGAFERLVLSGCIQLEDPAVGALVARHAGSLRSLALDGCSLLGDAALLALSTSSSSSSLLEDLDVSGCSVTDGALIQALPSVGLNLRSLNLSHCILITDIALPHIERECPSLDALNLTHCPGLSRSALDAFESRFWKCDVLSS